MSQEMDKRQEFTDEIRDYLSAEPDYVVVAKLQVIVADAKKAEKLRQPKVSS